MLDIDSPGGRVDDLLKMLDVIRDHRNVRTVAYVRQGLSAAAILAAACQTIYVHPSATIGAAPIVTRDADAIVAAKYTSAQLAAERAAVERAGRSTLFVEAMTDIDAEVSITGSEGGKPWLVRGHPPGSTWLKHQGAISTFTAPEAVGVGLADATAEPWMFRAAAGLGDRSDAAQDAMVRAIRATERQKVEEQSRRAAAERDAAKRRAQEVQQQQDAERSRQRAAVVNELNRALDRAKAEGRAAVLAKDRLHDRYNDDRAAIDRVHERALAYVRSVALTDGSRYAEVKQQAQQNYEDALAELDRRYRPAVQAADTRIEAATQAVLELMKRINELGG